MRILVLSDSHGNVENMARCVELTQPNAILHLGDCQRDAEALHRLYPAIPLQGVRATATGALWTAPRCSRSTAACVSC